MSVCCTNQCAFCRSPIVSGQRWVREKIYDSALNGREPSYHRYHAEPFAGQEGSCWEKHQMEEEIARATPTPLTRNTTQWEEKQLPVLI
jgi:hypothetical protein